MTARRFDHIDLARGIAIILVVWGHADRRMDQQFYIANLELVSEVIYAFHVALFFIISGSLMRRMLEEIDLPRIIIRIIRATLAPFFTLSMAFMVLMLLDPRGLLNTPTLLEMLQGVFLYQSSDWAPSGILWFLFVLFTSTVITSILYKYIRLSLLQILIIALVIKLLSPLVDDVNLFAAGKFARNYVFLVLGLFFAETVKDDRFELLDVLFIFAAILAFLAFFLLMDTYKPFFQLMTGVLGSYVVLKLSSIAAKFNVPFLNVFKYCGVNSILIFVFHMPFFTIIKPVIFKQGLEHSFVGFGLWVFLGCFLPLVLGAVLQQTPIIYELLFGRKPVKSFSIFQRGWVEGKN